MAIWQYSGFVINFLVQISLTFLLPTSYFGYMATLQASMELLTGITTLSFHGSLYRKYDENIEKITNHALLLGLLQAVVALSLSSSIAYYLYVQGTLSLLAIGFCCLFQLAVLASNFKMIIYTALEKNKTFVRNSQIEAIVNLLVGIGLIVWAWLFPSEKVLMTKLILPSILLSSIYIGYYYFKGFRVSLSNIDTALLKFILQNSLRNYFARITDSFLNRLDILLAKFFFNDFEIGVYERMKYFAGLPNYLLTSINTRILLVRYGSPNKQLHILQRVNFINFTTNFVLYIGLFLALYCLSFFIQLPLLQAVFPLYFGLWYLCGLNTIKNNIRIYLFIKSHVLRNAVKLFVVPSLFFSVSVACLYLLNYKVSMTVWACVYSLSYITSFLVLPKEIYLVNWKKYTAYYWYWGKKKYKHFQRKRFAK